MKAVFVFVFVLVGCTPALPPPNLDISQELSIRRFYWAGRPQCYMLVDAGKK